MNTSIVDRLLDTYIAVGDGAIQAIRPDVMYILVTLAMIGLTWAHLRNAITARESPLNLLIVQFMMVGFFVWLLNNWASLMKVFMEGMIKLGLKAGGFAMSPEQTMRCALAVTWAAVDRASVCITCRRAGILKAARYRENSTNEHR